MSKQKSRTMVHRVFVRAARLAVPVITALLLAPGAQAANASPTPSLTIVVPFAAGGPSDGLALAFAEAARRQWPYRPIFVENAGGGGGTVGASRVAAAVPDGSVVLLQNIASAAAPALYKLPYDTLTDFEYLGMIAEVPMTLVGRPGLPGSLTDLKSDLTLANAGIGSASHLCGMLIEDALKRRFTQKTYTGNGPAMADVVSGTTDLLCDTTTSATKQIASGQVRAFGVAAPARVNTRALRNVPTLQEQGLPGVNISVWFALCAPKGTPQPALEQLNALLRSVAADPVFIEAQESKGALVIKDQRLFPGEHKRFVASQIEHWGVIIRTFARSDVAALGN